jgi:DNA-binding beta-propeller fold protein YncE
VGGDGRVSRRSLVRFCLAVCAAVAACTAGAASPTLGARAHAFSFVFGSAGSGAGAVSLASAPLLESPGSGVAVNDATHNVYVADTENRRIDEFDSKGQFIRAWGWGVATGAVEFQVCTATCRAGLSGSAPGQFETPSYVAVDNGASSASKGDVYVADTADNLVTKFDSEGHLVTTWGNNGENAQKEHTQPNGQLNGSPTEVFNGGHGSEPLAGIAVDGAGHLWAYDITQELFEFKEDGTFMQACTAHIGGAKPGAIGISDMCTEHCGINVLSGFRLAARLKEECAGAGFVSAGNEVAKSLAVDGSNGDIYIDRAGERIEDIPADCKPAPEGCQPSQIFGEELALLGVGPPPPLSEATGLAVDSGSGVVYVANTGTQQIAAFGVVIAATSAPATSVSAHSAVLHGTVNPSGSELSTPCRFEYGTSTGYGISVPCEQSPEAIGQGSEAVPVSAKVENLNGLTTYHFRLHARNAHGLVSSEDRQFETATTAVIKKLEVRGLTGTSAKLVAVVNPSGLAAQYHFEYGECEAESSCVSSPFTKGIPAPDATIAAGSSDVEVSQVIEGLNPSSTYHVRIAVSDTNGLATPSPEATFVFEPAALGCTTSRPASDEHLADCRAYEMVTPREKDGALIDNGAFLTGPSVAPNGSRVFAKSIQCFHSPSSCTGIRQTEGDPFSFERTADGWATTALAPPVTVGSTMVTYDAETGLVLYTLAAVPPAREEFYARATDGSLHAIGPISEAPGVQVAKVASSLVVTTSDFDRIVYKVTQQWPSLEGTVSGANLLEYSGTGNTSPTLVPVTGPAGSTSMISACGSFLGGTSLSPPRNEYNTLSEDGRTVFFTVAPCFGGTGANAGIPVPADELYARIEQAAGMKTVQVSASGGESECDTHCREAPPGDAAYQGASSDGSRVYFTSTRQLTNEASEDSRSGDKAFQRGCYLTNEAAPGCNLYEFECPDHCENPASRHIVDVSAGDNSGLGPQVQGVIAIPAGGSDVYFVAHGTLTTGANPAGQEPVPGSDNLYVYRTATGGAPSHLAFIATLAESDQRMWTKDDGLGIADVTPDGRFLVFPSHRALTRDATTAEGPAQIYRYDAATEQLQRVSIGSHGFNDNGNNPAGDARIVEAEKGMALGTGVGRADPTMSDNGQFVFFQSPAGLTPGALDNQHVLGNNAVLAQNVYEWSANGAKLADGGTVCEQAEGCVSLVSDGKDVIEGSDAHANASAVELLGADQTGENVFFWTADPLVPQDTDTQVDLYDARVGGGFPAPPAPPVCEAGVLLSGEVCRGAGSTPGVFSAPGSVLFSGPPNPAGEAKPGGKPSPRGLTRAQKLRRALAACRARYRTGKAWGKRRVCERQARHRYGPVVKRRGSALAGRGGRVRG